VGAGCAEVPVDDDDGYEDCDNVHDEREEKVLGDEGDGDGGGWKDLGDEEEEDNESEKYRYAHGHLWTDTSCTVNIL